MCDLSYLPNSMQKEKAHLVKFNMACVHLHSDVLPFVKQCAVFVCSLFVKTPTGDCRDSPFSGS